MCRFSSLLIQCFLPDRQYLILISYTDAGDAKFKLQRLIRTLNPDISQTNASTHCLLISQENFPQASVIIDTLLLWKIPCKTNILRDPHANL